jgi:hypothetical protein
MDLTLCIRVCAIDPISLGLSRLFGPQPRGLGRQGLLLGHQFGLHLPLGGPFVGCRGLRLRRGLLLLKLTFLFEVVVAEQRPSGGFDLAEHPIGGPAIPVLRHVTSSVRQRKRRRQRQVGSPVLSNLHTLPGMTENVGAVNLLGGPVGKSRDV